MDAQLGKAAFTFALFIIIGALLLLPFQEWGSAESVVTVMALGVGVLFLAIIVLIVRRTLR